MRFSIDGQTQTNWVQANLDGVLNFIKTNTFWFHSEADRKVVEGFLYTNKLLGNDTYKLFPKFLELSSPIINKKNLVKFNMSIKDNTPIIENGYSFVFIDLDLKNLNLKPLEGVDRDDLVKDITDQMLTSFEMAYDSADFKEGLIYAKKSFSKKGLHLLYRIPATTDVKDIKIAGFEIARRLEKEFKIDLFKTNVFDTAVFGNNWNGYFNYVEKGSWFINDTVTVLDLSKLDDKRKDSNLKSFGQLYSYRQGKIKNLHCNPERVETFKKAKSIAQIWNTYCGNMTTEYVTGNQNNLFFCEKRVKNSNWSKEQFIEWLESNKSELLDSKKMFGENGNKTVREHINYYWDRIKVYETDSEAVVEDIKDTSIFIEGKLNKTLFETYIYNSGFKRLIVREKEEVKESILVYLDGFILNKIEQKNLLVSDYWINFLKELNIFDPHQRTTLNNYINSNIHIIDLPLLEYDDILIDTEEICYLFTIDGPIEVTKNSHRLLKDDEIKPYFRKSIASEWYKIGIPTNFIKYNPKLDIKKWNERNIFNYIHPEPEKLMKLTGYLLHRYKDENYNVALLDSFEGKDGGGTGKSLISYLTAPVRNVAIIERPNTSDPFWLANYDIASDILLLNECPRDFNIEVLRPIRDMSLTIERKGIDRKNLGVLTPRCILNSNFQILSDSYADKRRITTIVFDRTIKQEELFDKFGHKWFFEKHDSEWWSKYLLLMIECIQLYLEDRNIKYEIDNGMLQRRKLEELHNNDYKIHIYEQVFKHAMENVGKFLNLSDIKKDLDITDNTANAKIYNYIKMHLEVNNPELEFEQCTSDTKDRKRGFKIKYKNIKNIRTII